MPLEITFAPLEDGGDATFLWEFGDGGTSTERSPSHTYQDAGDLMVRLTASKGDSQTIAEKMISLEPGEAGWITVEPSSLVLESGERSQFTASAFDALGNPVEDASFSWISSESAGSVLEDGTFIAGPKVGEFSDAIKVEYERLGITATLDVPVEIVFGPLDSINIEPPSINVRANNRIDFKVIATDRQGHIFPEPDIDWDVIRAGVDTILAGGEFRAGVLPTPSEQELVEVRVSVGSQTLKRSISGTITTGILDLVEVTASLDQVTVGAEVTFSATGYDRFGNELPLESVEWELVDSSYGEVTADGVFTPSGAAVTATGPLLIAIGELDRVQSLADIELDVLPGIATGISLSPQFGSIPVGASNPFLALVVDEFGNVIEGIDVEWSANGGGTVNDTGIFSAGFETGEFLTAITATLPAGASGNLTEITASADMTIRDRSSNMLAIEVSNETDAGIILIDLVSAAILPLSEELDTNDGVELAPAWWPDGSRLAYVSDVSGTLQIYDIEIETGDIRQLVDIPDGSALPAISPDGTQIAFVIPKDINWQLYVADMPQPDAEGNIVPITLDDATKLSDNDDVQNLLPWWSPDGTKILFTISRSVTDVDINVVLADGSSAPELISVRGLSVFGWSDDGEFILAVDNQSAGGQSLVVLDSETGDVVGLIPLPFQAFLAAWGPDNSEAAVIDRITGALWLLNADGSSLRQAVGSAFVPRRVSWRPIPIDAEAVLAEQAAETAALAEQALGLLLQPGDDPEPPSGALDTSRSYTAKITTEKGEIVIELFDDIAPIYVENFVNLSRIGFYDGLTFHRVISEFMAQGGDPQGTGAGGPGYIFPDQFHPDMRHDEPGIVSMANAGLDTNGSQFFITHVASPHLDPFNGDGTPKSCANSSVSCHAVFGRVIEGMDVVLSLRIRDPGTDPLPGDKIITIEIEVS